jgi:dolichol-phosphate mannosyltransferase
MGEPEGKKRLVSIIVPAKDEEGNVPRLYRELTGVMESLPYDYEVLFMDNCSTDATGELARKACREDPRWRYVRFSRDFKPEVSMAAGLYYCRGDAAIVLFSDLQDPPEKIPELLKKWEEGFDVAYGLLTRREGESLLQRAVISLGYRAISAMSEIPVPPNATDFRLYSRRVIDALNRVGDSNRYLRGLSAWVGFPSAPVPYARRPRTHGKSKAGLSLLIGGTMNAITLFARRPFWPFSALGVLALGVSALMAVLLAVKEWFGGMWLHGFTSVHLLLLLNLGVMSLGVGMIGEFAYSAGSEARKRPRWIVESAENIQIPDKVHGGDLP